MVYCHSSHQSCYLIGTPHPQIYEQLCVGSSYHIYSMWPGHGTYMAPAFRCDNARHLLRNHWPRCSNHLFEFKWNRDFNGMIMLISDGDHNIVDVSISSNLLSFHRESIAPVYQAGMTQAARSNFICWWLMSIEHPPIFASSMFCLPCNTPEMTRVNLTADIKNQGGKEGKSSTDLFLEKDSSFLSLIH